MSNPQQNDIKNEKEQIKRIINLLQDRLQLNLLQLKRSKKNPAKWTKANCKTANQKNDKMDRSELQKS